MGDRMNIHLKYSKFIPNNIVFLGKIVHKKVNCITDLIQLFIKLT